MLVAASANGKLALPEAMRILRQGGSALDAVEAAARIVESNLEDDSVGRGGLPNMLGEVELDASIMDGRTLSCGAVGALQGFEHAISVARKVMEELPHVMLVGEGAARFAREVGFPPANLHTPRAQETWQSWSLGPQFEGEPGWRRHIDTMRARAHAAVNPAHSGETVNFIALDAGGNLASAVSTSGMPWKYPGRLGDSPIIGAGNYCDNRFGAATLTGRGETVIRAGAARALVLLLQLGYDLVGACRHVMGELAAIDDPYKGTLNVIAVNPQGRHMAASTSAGATYAYMTEEHTEPVEAPRRHLPE